jgi:hypothetical protein
MLNKIKYKDVLKPYGELDVLLYYGLIMPKLKKFLAGKELAAKNHIPKGGMPYLIKRGSKEEPLYVEEFLEAVDEKFLQARKELEHLKDARGKITKLQERVWGYFLPRKLSDLFYAANNEGEGKNIDRVFFDLDRGKGATANDALETARAFVKALQSDKELMSNFKGKPFIFWTGSSFHVYLFLKEAKPNSFYEKHIKYSSREALDTNIEKIVNELMKENKKIVGGHEKVAGKVSIDPSQTPSGKLARVPFSLHMKDAKTVDGIAIPITLDMLSKEGLIKELQAYTPEKVVKELDELAKRLPG